MTKNQMPHVKPANIKPWGRGGGLGGVAVISFTRAIPCILCRLDSVSLAEFTMVKGTPVLPMVAFGVNLKLTSSIGMVRDHSTYIYSQTSKKSLGIIYNVAF